MMRIYVNLPHRNFKRGEQVVSDVDGQYLVSAGHAVLLDVMPDEQAKTVTSVTPDDDPGDALEYLTKSELIELASALGVDINPRDKKDVILSAIREAQ